MNESARAFLKAVGEDDELHAAVEAVDLKSNQAAEQIVAIAAEHGFELTVSDLTSAVASSREPDLDELDGIAGGGSCSCTNSGAGTWTDYFPCDCSEGGDGQFGSGLAGDEPFMMYDYNGVS